MNFPANTMKMAQGSEVDQHRHHRHHHFGGSRMIRSTYQTTPSNPPDSSHSKSTIRHPHRHCYRERAKIKEQNQPSTRSRSCLHHRLSCNKIKYYQQIDLDLPFHHCSTMGILQAISRCQVRRKVLKADIYLLHSSRAGNF